MNDKGILGSKENPIYMDITHFKDMCNLLLWINEYDIKKSTIKNEWLLEEMPITTENLVIKFIKFSNGTDKW